MSNKPKIAIVTTVGFSLDKLFPEFYPLLIKHNYEVVGICANDDYVENVRRQGVRVITVPMTRNFTPIKDLKSLWLLYKIFRKENFDIIHFNTPKASLLASIAGRLCSRSILLYTLRGLGYTAYSGMKRQIAKHCEIITCWIADYIIAISHSLRQYAVKEGVANSEKVHVLGQGSSKGVNLRTFRLDGATKLQALHIRKSFGIDDGDIVLGYVGRLTNEKGIVELYRAFRNILENNIHILLVGEQDNRNPLPDSFIRELDRDHRVHRLGFQEKYSPFLAAMDIFVMPSYREGFGNVIIEASALKRPVISTDIPGCRDAVMNNQSGIMVGLQDIKSLQQAIEQLIRDPKKRKTMGQIGREWVKENFNRDIVWDRNLNLYEQIILHGFKRC